MPTRRRTTVLLVLLGLIAFGSSMTGSFWVVFLHEVHGAPAPVIAALFGTAAFAAVLTAMGMTLKGSVPATPSIVAGIACIEFMQLALGTLRGPALFALFSLLYGAYIPLFFLPWNTMFASETRAHDRAAKFAGFPLVVSIATIGAPFLGGLVAGTLGFPALFIIGAGVLAGAALFAIATGRRSERVRLAWNPALLGRETAIAYAAQGGIEGVLWTSIPLVALSFVGSTVLLGAVFSLFALSGGVFAVLLGRWSDRIRHRRRFILLGVGLSIPLAIAVGLAPDLVAFTVANGALSATLAIAPTFVNAAVVDRLEHEIGPVMQTREVILNLSRGASSVGILALFLLGVPVQLAVLLVAGFLPLQALAERGA